MKRRLLALTAAVLMASPAFAGDSTDTQAQIEQLKQQMQALQAKIGELEAQKGVGAKAVTGLKSGVKVYGRIKMDAIYDTHNMGADQFIKILPKAEGKDRVTFNTKDTRIGLIINGPEADGWKTTGRFEGGFYGNGGNDNGLFRIRLSYINLNNGQGTNIRFGQDYVPIARQMASTLDFFSLASAGNLWDRVPQITVTQKFNNGFGVLATAYKSSAKTDGVDMRMPWVGAKAFYKGDVFGTGKPIYLALGGAYRNGDATVDSVKDNVNDYLVAGEWNLPFTLAIPMDLKGEAYVGQGLDTRDYLVFSKPYYRSGNSVNELQTYGGFAQLSMKPLRKVKVNLGYGIDNPDNSDARKAGTYTENWRVFGNALYSLAPNVSLGAEVQHAETHYPGDVEHGEEYMVSAIYNW